MCIRDRAYADLLYEQDRHGAILAELPLATTWRDVATPVELISRGKLVMARARFFAGAAEQGLEELDEWLAGLQGPGYERVFAIAMGCKAVSYTHLDVYKRQEPVLPGDRGR